MLPNKLHHILALFQIVYVNHQHDAALFQLFDVVIHIFGVAAGHEGQIACVVHFNDGVKVVNGAGAVGVPALLQQFKVGHFGQ